MKLRPEESWRPIPWCPLYEVSDLGRVRNPYGRQLATYAAGKEGYPAVNLVRYEEDKKQRAGRSVAVLVLQAFVGPCPEGCVAFHRDFDLENNRLDNLSWQAHGDVFRAYHARRRALAEAAA